MCICPKYQHAGGRDKEIPGGTWLVRAAELTGYEFSKRPASIYKVENDLGDTQCQPWTSINTFRDEDVFVHQHTNMYSHMSTRVHVSHTYTNFLKI